VRWKTEWSFDGKFCQKYSYQKLSKSDNWFSSYSQKCRECFLVITFKNYFCKTNETVLFSENKLNRFAEIRHCVINAANNRISVATFLTTFVKTHLNLSIIVTTFTFTAYSF